VQEGTLGTSTSPQNTLNSGHKAEEIGSLSDVQPTYKLVFFRGDILQALTE